MSAKQDLAAFKERLIFSVQQLERKYKTRFNQTELANRWGTSPSSVSLWLAGKGIPERLTIKAIAADCGVDPGWLDWGTMPDGGTPLVRPGDEKITKRS